MGDVTGPAGANDRDERAPEVEPPESPAPAPVYFAQTPYRVPAGATEVLLVRHGASAPFSGTPHPLLGGHGNPALDATGVEQARLVGERLAHERIDAIYVSPLRRAIETAAFLADALAMTPTVDDDLREVHLGEWEGGVIRERVARRDPVALQMYSQERWDVIGGAESNASLDTRVRSAIERIVVAHGDGRVVAFVHGGVIGAALRMASGSTPFAFVRSDNGSISSIVVDEARWLVRRYNDTSHLAPLDPSPPDLGVRGTPAGG